MSDSTDHLIQGFIEGVGELSHDLTVDLEPKLAHNLGKRAAVTALAPAIWSERAGHMVDTSQVSKMFGISRQALAKRVAAGTLLGLPGRGTTHYPVWQFGQDGQVRDEALSIFKAFTSALGKLDPYVVTSWMKTPLNDLQGLTPEEWMFKHGDPKPLLQAAHRSAGRLAS